MWYKEIHKYCSWKRQRKGIHIELVPDKWFKQYVMRKDNDDGTTEMMSIDFYNNIYI